MTHARPHNSRWVRLFCLGAGLAALGLVLAFFLWRVRVREIPPDTNPNR
jgi:hypothetical protein